MLSLQKEIVYDDKITETAAVGMTGLNITLYVNDKFWNSLTDTQQLAVLHHECLHICFFHLTENFKCDHPELMNICEDGEINQLITGLPAGCVTLDSLSKLVGHKLKPKAGSWYYYKELLQAAQGWGNKEGEEFGSGIKSIDDHSHWPKDMSEAEKEIYKGQIKQRIENACEAVKKQAGTVPGEIEEILKQIQQKPPIFNWKGYFRRMVGNSITSEIRLTRMRLNKRFPDAKGMISKRKPEIMIGVDTSGSVSTEDLNDFFSEVNHIYKSGVKVTVVECDTKITNIFEYKGHQEIKITGRGGTILKPVIDYYKEHKNFSACILFTDGYCETNMSACHNLIWVITHDGNKSQKFTPGQVILIP